METQSESRGEELKAMGHTQAADAKEDLQESRRIERFDIPLNNLKSMFENPTTQNTEVKDSSSSTRRVQEHRGKGSSEIQGPNQREEMSDSPDCGGVSIGGAEGEVETVPLKERLALYKAAISKEEKSTASVVMEDSEACSLPGGLASVKKQFESQKVSSSSQNTVTQYHYQQRQEVMSSSETSVRSSVRESHDIKMSQDQKLQQNVASSFGNHFDEKVVVIGDQELAKISTQALKQQHEKNIEEATPSKHIKIDLDYNQFQWAPVNMSSSKVETGSAYESVNKTAKTSSASFASSSAHHESAEQFPPPPPTADLLQVPVEELCCSSPQPPDQHGSQKYPITKEQYSKQRNLYELKRLYKHIHPEVRKNLERDFITEMEHSHVDSDEEVSGDVQQARYVFENNGSSPGKCMSPEREYLEWDEILKGEVQSMRWMFENKPLDTIKDDTPDENESRNIAQQEIIAGKDVKYTTWMFETQPIDALGTETPDSEELSRKLTDLARGDVQTATWLFETQPLDTMNKIYQEDDEEEHAVYTKDIAGGDVKTARYLFETQHLDSLGHTETIDETHFLQLKSELEEIKGEVRTTTKMFETHPMCVIRGDSGEMLEITTVRREETEKGDVKTSRWLFETQPLDMINKDPTKVKIICGVSMEENYQGGVNRGRWLFETKTLDQIKDEEMENTKTQKEEIMGADVRRHCMVFETQPMDSLKDNDNARPSEPAEIIGGDVTSARHLFETVPMENLKELPEVGKLEKVVALEEEKGDVRHQRWLFESKPLEQIREDKKEITRTVKLEELDKGDVINCKEIFETLDLSKCTDTQKIAVEGVTSGSVKSNKVLFESTPLYAIEDSSGQYHEVKTVHREEIVKGDVRSCKWMFETRPIDQFDDSINKFQIIKGISKQEIESGDVKTAKWLFETQPLDGIKYFSNMEEEDNRKNEATEIQKGDVKTCRWLFETQPMDELYEKAEVKTEDATEIQKGDVKTCTWLFETQNLDSIKDESETVLKTCTVQQEDVQGKDVRLARFLFETENLENIKGTEDQNSFKRVTQIDIQSGDVSRMKYIFETQAADIMTSTSEETMQQLKSRQTDDIQKGNVVNCTWMFENQPIDAIRDNAEESRDVRTVTDVQGGNVDKGRFIFETYSLDTIQEDSSKTEINKLQSIIREEIEKGDVKNYTMMFETQPLYAIRDKEGHFHEVTTVTKEEILRGDVIGARWLFETKPLDSIRETDEVYLIKAVTEEDIQKGDVNTARWRFETQPLDQITEDMKVTLKTVADIQGGDVKTNMQRFENDDMSQKHVRTVSVSEIQKGDVRSSTWMFETRTIDKIRGEGSEYDDMEKVTQEEVLKGDVKQSVWLFEKQPLDCIKESDGTEITVSREEIPKADVKTTTWLFETTALTDFNETNVEKTEIIGKSVKETLEELYSQKMVDSQGIILEADEIGDIRMAKYKLLNQESPEIQREEVIRGDLNSIMMNLLNRRETTERGITIDVEERGNINTTVKQLFSQDKDVNVEKEEIIRGDIQEAINNLLKKDGTGKHGILIQEDEKGDVRMTIYALLNKEEENRLAKEDIVKGNVRGTVNRLLYNSDGKDQASKIQISDTERGNVSFYSTCIESGALDYLKQFQLGSDETYNETAKEKIIGGDVENTKLILRNSRHEVGRTVAEDEIVPGDVHNTVQVFMMEPVLSLHNVEKEEIVKGDLRATLDSLTQAVNQRKTVEKEEVVKGNINTTLRSLEEAQNQLKAIERPEIVCGDIQGALESLERSTTAKTEVIIDDVVAGDIKGTLKSLEEAKQAVKEVDKEEIVRGDIQAALLNLQEASTEKKLVQHQVSEQGDVKGTIQLLMEPVESASLHMQRRASTEGDVKMSIKSLHEQEQSQIEKEEVVKGDVHGTIKCLMKKKEQSSQKSKINPSSRVKTSKSIYQVDVCECPATAKVEISNPHPSKNMPKKIEAGVSTQKQTEVKSDQSQDQIFTQEQSSKTNQIKSVGHSESSQISHKINVKEKQVKQKGSPAPAIIKKCVGKETGDKKTENSVVSSADTKVSKLTTETTKQTQEIKTVTQTTVTKEHTTITQKNTENLKSDQNVKSLKTEQNIKSLNRNLNPKGMIKKKSQPEIHFPPPPTSPPPPSESEFSLPPPPSPVTDPCSSPHPHLAMRQDSDPSLPPPPPPPAIEAEPEFFPPPPQDLLPPPPSQQELYSVTQPNPAKPKSRPIFKVPKPEPPKQSDPPKAKWQKKQTAQPAPPPPPPPPPPQPFVHKQKEKEDKHVTSVTETIVKEKKHNENAKSLEVPLPAVTEITSKIPVQTAKPEESCRPKKVFVPPIKLPPPPEPDIDPKPRPYARKFKTPLMLAEERYRKQRDEAEKSKTASTPTSPPENIHIQDLDLVNTRAESTTEKHIQSQITVEAYQVCPSAPVTVPKETATGIQEEPSSKVAKPQTPQKEPTTFQVGKPSFPQIGKKLEVTSDKKQVTQAKAEIKVQPKSPIPSPPTSEHQESLKASSQTTIFKRAITQSIQSTQSEATIQCQSAVSKKAEETVTEETKTVSPQPTKIPKVTPSFKVKTIKVPKQEKLEEKKEASQNVEQTTISQVYVDQGSSKMEKQEQVEQITKDTKLEKDLKKTMQKPKKQLSVVAPKPSVEMHHILPAMSMGLNQQVSGQTKVVHSQQAIKEEHVLIHEEKVVSQSSVQQQSIQQKGKFQIKKHIKSSEMPAGDAEAIKQNPEKEIKEYTVETLDMQKYEEIQKLLSHIKVMQESGKMDVKVFKIMLAMIPEWLLGATEKLELSRAQYNKQKLQEIIVYVKNLAQLKLTFLEANLAALEKMESKSVEQKKAVGGATQKISKISIGSAKVDSQKKFTEKTVQDIKNIDLKTELRMRTPSPTYICIETAKRTDSPLLVTHSPPLYRSGATPTPPPRWSESSTNFSRATPSPTISRSEKLSKLRDTTKLSHGTSPLPVALPEQVVLLGETENSHSSTHQEISFESHMMESSMLQSSIESNKDSMFSVKDKKEFFEEAQKAEMNRHYMRKDPIDIPERLGSEEDNETGVPIDFHERMKEDMPRVDLSRLVNKFESPKPTVYIRKDPIVIPERLGSDTEDAEHELEKKSSQVEEIPSFDIKALKNVFEMGEQAHQYLRDDKKNLEMQEQLAEPTGFSEAKSVTEHYSTVDEFGNKVVGSRSQSTAHSQSVTTRLDPPTYADVVRGKGYVLDVPPEATAEQLLKNFQQSWVDSENVFKNLGFSVSEQHSSQSVSHQQHTVITGKIKIRVPDNELCRVCRKRVYPMEALIADKQNFHKTCFRCAHCNSQLSLGNYAPLHGRIYCKPHYNQLFKSKGNYDEGFGEKPYRDFWSTKKQKNTSEKVNQVSPLPSMKSDTKESPVSKENELFPAEMKESSMLDDNAKKSMSKIAIAWPPQSETPKKSFTLEEELKVVKPAWPPKEEATDNTEPALREKKVITNENQREHSDDAIKALPEKMVSEPPAPPQVQTDVLAAVEQEPKVAECNAQQGEQTDGKSEMKDKKEVLEMNGDYGGESNNVEKVKEHERENTKENEESEETTGVKVTVIDGVATAEQPANGNANNNNNNNNNNHQLLDFGDPGLDMDDAKAESDILDFYSPNTQQSNTKEETIHKEGTNPKEETKTKEVTNTFEKTDSKAESDTKETMRANLLLLLQDDNRPPPSANEENVSDAKLEHHSDQQTNFSASQFLDDIFAGFGESTSFFPREESSTKPSATLLDDLMDFGMETKEVSENKKTLENSCIDYSNSKAASCLWGDDLQSLSVEEQIKRNRYYDDDDDEI